MELKLSLEEFLDYHQKGVLESYLLSNGILFKDALNSVLALTDKRVTSLEEELLILKDRLEDE